MRKFAAIVAMAGLALAVASPAAATLIGLSEFSSESEEGGTPANVLLASMDFAVAGSTLTLSVENFSNYDITEVWFNTSADVEELSVTLATGWELVHGPAMVDGMGDFDWGLTVTGDIDTNPATINPTETEILTFAITCASGTTCDMMDFALNNPNGKAVVAKFVNGGPAFGDPNDSAFGASGEGFPPVPEPATAALLALGLAGLALRRRAAL